MTGARVTPERRASRQQEQLRLRAIVEQLADGILIVGADRLIRFANPAAEQLFARRADQLVGTEFGFPIASAGPTEIDVRRPNGHSVNAEIRIVEIVWEGTPARLVSLRDVTDRRRAEERARLLERERTARAEAEAANHAKSEFLTTMSHELRTPLNAVIGYSDLLELGVNGQLTPEQRHQVSRIRAGGHHLLELVNEVLDLARIEAGRLTLSLRAAPAAVAADAALALTQPIAEARGLEFTSECGGNRDLLYEGDEHRTRQILVNLLSNSVKFTPPGGRVALECGATTTPPADLMDRGPTSWIYFRVTDTGVGIPPDKLAKVFDPFVQVDSGHTRSSEGSGLGLTISRRLARLMHGDLTVTSAAGHGSEFTLWLPAATGSAELVEETGVRLRAEVRPEGLSEVGKALLGEIKTIVEYHVARLQNVQRSEGAELLTFSQLADHVANYVADVACILIAIEEADGRPSNRLTDASELHRLIADRHGAQRARVGWSVDGLRREYALLNEALSRALDRIGTVAPPNAVAAARDLVSRFLDHGQELATRALARGLFDRNR